MNNLEAFMPFYGDDYFTAVAGWPEKAAQSYLRAIWHYWKHEQCKGLRNEDEYLRRVCQCDKDDWEEVRGYVFDNDKAFTLDADPDRDSQWQQGRAQREYDASKAKYESAVRRGKMGGPAKWKKPPDKLKGSPKSKPPPPNLLRQHPIRQSPDEKESQSGNS